MQRWLIALLAYGSAHAAEVKLTLERIAPGPVSFGLPLPPELDVNPAAVSVTAGKTRLPAHVEALVWDYDAQGKRGAVRSLLIQLPQTANPKLEVVVHFSGGTPAGSRVPYAQASLEAPETVRTARRTIVYRGGGAVLVED